MNLWENKYVFENAQECIGLWVWECEFLWACVTVYEFLSAHGYVRICVCNSVQDMQFLVCMNVNGLLEWASV